MAENGTDKKKIPIAVWVSIVVIACSVVTSFSLTKYKSDQNEIKLEKACTSWERDRDKLSSSLDNLTKAIAEQTTETKLLKQEIQFIRSERRR